MGYNSVAAILRLSSFV